MKFPFEVSFSEIQADLDSYISGVFSCLESEFLVMPKGPGFVEYPVFEKGYEELKRATFSFNDMSFEHVFPVALKVPISIIILRSMLGFTPPEWAYIAKQRTGH